MKKLLKFFYNLDVLFRAFLTCAFAAGFLPDVPEFHQSINCIHFENLDITDKKSFHKSRNKKTPRGHDIF